MTLMRGQSLPTPPEQQAPGSDSLLSVDVLPNVGISKSPQDEFESPADPGTLNLHDSGTSYVQSVHWEAILTKIKGLREDLIADSKAPPGSQLFYGPNRHASRDEILLAIPPRTVVDRLMALHFDSHFVTPCQYIYRLFLGII